MKESCEVEEKKSGYAMIGTNKLKLEPRVDTAGRLQAWKKYEGKGWHPGKDDEGRGLTVMLKRRDGI